MKPVFSEIAHLYLGCSVSTPNGISTIVGVGTLGSENQKIRTLKAGMSVTRGYGFSEIKPILRSLVDMTDMECLELAKLCTRNGVETISRIDRNSAMEWIEIFCDDTSEKIDIMGGRFSWSERDKSITDPMKNPWSYIPIENIGDVILWCLKKHFDIFQLVHSGQAIDASKNN